jgi:hypothetical protein
MIKLFFYFFYHIHLQGAECGFISAVNLYFFRLSSTFSTSRAVKNPNLRADMNPEKQPFTYLHILQKKQ